jgi:ribose transport system ATP-binding protein
VTAAIPQPLLRAAGVEQAFGAVRALRGAELAIESGSVHGLVGHNGAGKSTLVRVISGFLSPDAGEVQFDGESIAGESRRQVGARGIWTVPQELTVLPDLTVADNVTVGGEPRRGFIVSRREQRRQAERTMALLGLDGISVDTPVSALRPSEKRVVMIAMAVNRSARLLILDEPTASLGTDEAQPLLELIESLPGRGITVLYVSHRLDEIERLCDRVTVMRDGLTRDVLARGEFDAAGLVSRMIDELPPAQARQVVDAGERRVSVRARGLHGSSLRGVDVEIPAGRVTGFTGLVGSGADELLAVIGGQIRPRAGEVEINGAPATYRDPAGALRAGVGFLPGTRAESAMTELSVRENVLVSSFDRVASGGWLAPRRERAAARRLVDPFGLADRTERPLGELSGGNQQKVLMARMIGAEVDILVVNDPTAGVDAKARADLHGLLRQVADEGKTVIVRCSEPEELLDLADEIQVLAGGRVVAILKADGADLGSLLGAAASSGAEARGSG